MQAFQAEATCSNVVPRDSAPEKNRKGWEWIEKTLEDLELRSEFKKKLIESSSVVTGLIQEAEGSLKSEIEALKAAGYKVTAKGVADGCILEDACDIIIAHPPWGHIDYLKEFHQQHPEIPRIISSGLYFAEEERDVGNRHSIDKDGIYIPRYTEIQDFLKFIEYLAEEVLHKGLNPEL